MLRKERKRGKKVSPCLMECMVVYIAYSSSGIIFFSFFFLVFSFMCPSRVLLALIPSAAVSVFSAYVVSFLDQNMFAAVIE